MPLNRQQIDLICPEHSRTSCDDVSLANHSYCVSDRKLPRCTRCYLIRAYINGFEDPNIEIIPTASLRFKEKPACPTCGHRAE